MIKNLTQHKINLQSTFSEASSENQEDRDKNQSSKLKRKSDFWSSTQNSDYNNVSNSTLWSRAIIIWIKE